MKEKREIKVGVCLFKHGQYDIYYDFKCDVDENTEWYKFIDTKDEYFDYNNLADYMATGIATIVNSDYAWIKYLDGKIVAKMKPSIIDNKIIKETLIREFNLEGYEIDYVADYSLINGLRQWAYTKKNNK